VASDLTFQQPIFGRGCVLVGDSSSIGDPFPAQWIALLMSENASVKSFKTRKFTFG
jgi:hypothetical protein